ncbi:MAG: hypothetical protein AAGI46_11955 [Planctomycetota bacterium]
MSDASEQVQVTRSAALFVGGIILVSTGFLANESGGGDRHVIGALFVVVGLVCSICGLLTLWPDRKRPRIEVGRAFEPLNVTERSQRRYEGEQHIEGIPAPPEPDDEEIEKMIKDDPTR